MNRANGFIALYRKMLDWEWHNNPNTLSTFIHILLGANHEDGVSKGVLVKRGQLLTSLPALAKETGQTMRQVRVSLDHLKMTGELTDESTNRYRIITVVKYDDYQNNDRQNGRQMTDNTADKRQATGHRYNNNNNINKETNINSPSENTPPIDDLWFTEFWEAYPKKTAKKDALKEWKKLKVGPELIAKIKAGLDAWKRSDQWTRDNGRFIPYPSTWLSKRRWEDDTGETGSPAPIPSSPSPAPVRVIAQNYDQRDYSDVQARALEAQRKRIEERLRRQSERDYSDVPGQIVDGLAKEIEQAKKEGTI